jgi:hypothetical protein
MESRRLAISHPGTPVGAEDAEVPDQPFEIGAEPVAAMTESGRSRRPSDRTTSLPSNRSTAATP